MASTDDDQWAYREIGKLEGELATAQAEVERLRELLEYCDECESAPCTMKCRTIRQAKIEVLREVRKSCQCGGAGIHEEKLAYGDGSPCICPNKICLAIGREPKQLEGE